MKTKETLISELHNISTSGWIPTYRSTSTGGVGHTLEYALGIDENNLALPDVGEYEIKAQKVKFEPSSLTTLVHIEPEPRTHNVVKWLLENFGWQHKKHNDEKSFRQTVTSNWSVRGFRLTLDDSRVFVDFDVNMIHSDHFGWRDEIMESTYRFIHPYWKHDDLKVKLERKLKNTIHATAASKLIDGVEHFKYCDMVCYEDFSYEKFLQLILDGEVYVDFNARTNHNHGTAFRIKSSNIIKLYNKTQQII